MRILQQGLFPAEPVDRLKVKLFMNIYKTLPSFILASLLMATSQMSTAGGYYHHNRHHHGHGGGIATALIVGGLFGYLIGESQNHYRSYGHSAYYSDYRPPATVVYQPVERVPVVVREESDSEFADNECIMTREYTTTVQVNGVDREAYGTRCMTPDGGWILGKAKLMPEY